MQVPSVYVDTADQLADLTSRWHQGGIVGMDTEFIRTNTFYPIPALYQVSWPDGIAIVDPLAIDEWGTFVALLVDPGVTKVMHSCSEDVEVFARHFGVVPAGIVDTQIAAAFVTGEFSPGYATLVERFTGCVLEKHETRSDWLNRPLTDKQLEYAAEDVRFLLPMFDSMAEGLRAQQRFEWFLEENTRRRSAVPTMAEEYYRQISNAWRLDRRGLARLRALSGWREQRARERDLPRRRVLADDSIVKLAMIPNLRREDIERHVNAPAVRRQAGLLVAAVAAAQALPEAELPAPLETPLDAREAAVLKVLKDHGREVANRLGVAEELLVRRRELESCVRSYRTTGQLPELFSGWRGPLVAATFENILRQAFVEEVPS